VHFEEQVIQIIDYIGIGIEAFGVAVIVIGIVSAGLHYLHLRFMRPEADEPYWSFKIRIGKTLLLGLEILVAADIVKTVALDPSWESIGILGLLVLIRTFLSWSLVVEIEGRWPWQPKGEPEG